MISVKSVANLPFETHESHCEVVVEEVALLDGRLLVRVRRVDLHLVLGLVVHPAHVEIGDIKNV